MEMATAQQRPLPIQPLQQYIPDNPEQNERNTAPTDANDEFLSCSDEEESHDKGPKDVNEVNRLLQALKQLHL
ncbi:hypothetical protein ACHAPE_004065, partial [Trichoderma viride]